MIFAHLQTKQEEAERQQESMQILHSEKESMQLQMELEKLLAIESRAPRAVGVANGARVQASGLLDRGPAKTVWSGEAAVLGMNFGTVVSAQ